jgi:hypothetical protein
LVEGFHQLFEIIQDGTEGFLLFPDFAFTGDGDVDIKMGLGQFYSRLDNLVYGFHEDGGEYPGSCAGQDNGEGHRHDQSDIGLLVEALHIRDFIINYQKSTHRTIFYKRKESRNMGTELVGVWGVSYLKGSRACSH